jgi:hypothetical protein
VPRRAYQRQLRFYERAERKMEAKWQGVVEGYLDKALVTHG